MRPEPASEKQGRPEVTRRELLGRAGGVGMAALAMGVPVLRGRAGSRVPPASSFRADVPTAVEGRTIEGESKE